MPVDNELKHGGVAEPIRRLMVRDTDTPRSKSIDQLKAFIDAMTGEDMRDRLLYLREVLKV
jgi:hypothetical protein